MYASPIVLIFSSPRLSAILSKSANISLSTATSLSGLRPGEKRVNCTRSANNTETASNLSAMTSGGLAAMRSERSFSRSAMGDGSTLRSSRSVTCCSQTSFS
ncbi:hypothetical protein D3C72_1989960 [compost metagenome]